MADSLPLIPEKGGAVCTDVRPVLREVFKDCDFLPPLPPQRSKGQPPREDGDNNPILPRVNQWIEKYDKDRKDIWNREGELKQQYAKRISREPLPNIYKLYPLHKRKSAAPSWKLEQGLLERQDLIPSLVQNGDLDDSLWVKNILNGSSGDVNSMVITATKLNPPAPLESPKESALQSVSIGELVTYPAEHPLPAAPPPHVPDYILCVPPQLDFVNFTVGHLHTQGIRLVNVSKFEVRLSVRPPSRRELDVELAGTRGLTVTSGAAAEIRVHFRPRDVRVLRDVLLVRVSSGQSLHVPISCYMQPPFLDILVPAISSSILSCTPGPGPAARGPVRSSECLELGARLLGDVHCVPLLFYCEAEHASFFLLTEDAWLSFNLDALTSAGSLVAGAFLVRPAWWAGGGAVGARAWCRAGGAGLHAAALRVLCSTAVVRPLNLIADALLFHTDHITLQAQEKDYDICHDDDPACEYYVHLGTAFPHRSLAATVQLVNHSPVVYSYYWSVRPWGACSCWEEEVASEGAADDVDSEKLCVGANEARNKQLVGAGGGGGAGAGAGAGGRAQSSSASCILVEPARGSVAARASCGVHVRAPDAGARRGTQRAVLMLILKDIPKESLPAEYDSLIIKTDLVESDPIPGIKSWTREVCEVVCTQMEVWWEVAPVRFVLDPVVLTLNYSRRITSVDVTVRATQLFGPEGIRCSWRVPAPAPAPPPVTLAAAHSCPTTLNYPLPVLPNEFPETDVITLEAHGGECRAACAVRRRCAARHPALRPARAALGVRPPGAAVRAALQLRNNTYQHICWWATPFRWHGENAPSAACADAAVPCWQCRELRCSCAIVRPARGALHPGDSAEILYQVNAPLVDGCVATLVRVQRTSADVARAAAGAGSDARAALLVYRVLAPRLALRVLPCQGDGRTDCEGCTLDEGDKRSVRGTATLRPKSALTLARRTCYRLRFTNMTPLATRVKWDPALEDDVLKVIFIPDEFIVGSYAQVEIQVVLEARKVCGRRLFVHRAQVLHAYKPIYLIIDAAIAGLEIICEVPIGGGEKTESTLVMRRTQPEIYPWDADKVKPGSPQEMFHEEDRKRAVRAENICYCRYNLVYIEPKKKLRPPPQTEDDYLPIEIVCEPPPLTRVCACFAATAPVLPDHTEAYCLQFEQLPLRTVRSRTIIIRNESALAGAWSAALRRWPRRRTRTLNTDSWAGDVREAGVCVECAPRGGVLGARGAAALRVRAYADCWGLYRDQLLIQIENLEPIVLDVWIEAVGAPLQFALSLARDEAKSPVLWMSAADPARSLRVKNASRAPLAVHSYTLTEHEHPQDALPFRLYLRFFDVLPITCPCITAFDDQSIAGESAESVVSSIVEEMDTGIELYFSPDYGIQDDSFYKITPETMTIAPGEWATWRVELLVPPHAEVAAPSAVLLRALPAVSAGEGWFRADPPAQRVRLRHSLREGRLKLSQREILVRICALDLPLGDVMRVRKRFRVQNAGNGPLEVCARTEEPWSVAEPDAGAARARCGDGCGCAPRAPYPPHTPRHRDLALHLLPRSSMEVCVEVSVRTSEAWPTPPEPPAPPEPPSPPEAPEPPAPPAPEYEPWRRNTTTLYFYDDDNVLETLPLVLEIEYPRIRMEPAAIDFGFVTDGDTRKSYFSVVHSSRTESLELVTEWLGGTEFRLWPAALTLRPGRRERLYVQYTARWCGAPAEGTAVVAAACGGGAWCRARGRVRAAPARGRARALPHDYTDDTRLLPPAHRRAE